MRMWLPWLPMPSREVVVVLVEGEEDGAFLRGVLPDGRVQDGGQRVLEELVAGRDVVLMSGELAQDQLERATTVD